MRKNIDLSKQMNLGFENSSLENLDQSGAEVAAKNNVVYLKKRTVEEKANHTEPSEDAQILGALLSRAKKLSW